jgi:hypothetical protein
MMPLPRVTTALREAHAQLPQKDLVRDLAYLLDVDPYGSESLVLYVKLGKGFTLPASDKRALESLVREKLQAVTGYQVFFRWFSEEEEDDGELVTTKSGLLDNPVSALH